jgi:hypothetical protein
MMSQVPLTKQMEGRRKKESEEYSDPIIQPTSREQRAVVSLMDRRVDRIHDYRKKRTERHQGPPGDMRNTGEARCKRHQLTEHDYGVER